MLWMFLFFLSSFNLDLLLIYWLEQGKQLEKSFSNLYETQWNSKFPFSSPNAFDILSPSPSLFLELLSSIVLQHDKQQLGLIHKPLGNIINLGLSIQLFQLFAYFGLRIHLEFCILCSSMVWKTAKNT